MSNAATSALRLHQRLPRVAFTREFLATLLLEDSAHYLLYRYGLKFFVNILSVIILRFKLIKETPKNNGYSIY